MQSVMQLRFLVRPDGLGIDFIHQENDFVDFDRDPLIFHMLSRDGPGTAKADVNKDGLDDVFIGGAKGQAGVLYLQSSSGSFKKASTDVFEMDKESEDVAAAFFDANGDGAQDLYVCSGGNEFSPDDPLFNDRLYINNGQGSFTKSMIKLPSCTAGNSSCVAVADYDADGDLDLFVGQRLKPFSYGLPVNGCVLQNDGKGNFTDVTKSVAPSLLNIGMITSGEWIDYDKDNRPDLVIAGEYMPLRLFHNEGGKLRK
jgi:hypothetical protein